jgi:hypothetical protein
LTEMANACTVRRRTECKPKAKEGANDSRRWHAEDQSFALSRCADASDLVAASDLDDAAQSRCVYTSRQAELHLYICEGLRTQLLGEVDSCQPDPLPRVAHQLPPHLHQCQCSL